jgi:hypothetical protein
MFFNFEIKDINGISSNLANFSVGNQIFAFTPFAEDDFFTAEVNEPVVELQPTINDVNFYSSTIINFSFPNGNGTFGTFSFDAINFNGVEFIAPTDFTGISTIDYSYENYCGISNVATITVNVLPAGTSSTIQEIACDSYTAPDGQIYTAAGQYTAVIPNSMGGDSTITIDLTINSSTMSSIIESSCAPYIAPDGQSYDASGIYTAIIPNMAGCDSTITIDFTATNPILDLVETACESYTDENGMIYSASGIYTYLKAGDVCDTIVVLDLTILNNSTSSISEVRTCEVYIAPDGQEISESGIYDITIPNAAGCDSIITIDLTITVPTTATVNVSSCDDYTAADGMVYTASGVYTATIPNIAGCDSIIMINYTKFAATFSTISPVVCGSFVSPNGQVLDTSGIYIQIIPNAKGCDSTITINLTANPIVTATVTLQGDTTATAFPADMSYQWLNCETGAMITSATNQIIQPIGGDYQVIVSNSFGCTDTTSCVTITNFANLSENDFSNLISIYPNPSNDLIYISLPENQTFKLNLCDVNGKVLSTINSGKAIETVSLVNFESGVYFIQFENELGSFTKRIIKN